MCKEKWAMKKNDLSVDNVLIKKETDGLEKKGRGSRSLYAGKRFPDKQKECVIRKNTRAKD